MRRLTIRSVVILAGIILGACSAASQGSTSPETRSAREQKLVETDSVLRTEATASVDYLSGAMTYKAKRNWPMMQECLVKALRDDKTNVKAWAELAWVCNETKEYERAGLAACCALLLDDENGMAWRELGYAEMQQKNFKKALKALNRAVELNADDVSAREYRDQVREKLRNP